MLCENLKKFTDEYVSSGDARSYIIHELFNEPIAIASLDMIEKMVTMKKQKLS